MPSQGIGGFHADNGILRIHLLDMGRERYGDCLLAEKAGRTVMIDGGHQGDWQSRNGFPSIPDQLEDILRQPAPFAIDLLVVTHCHSDHIGCLPTLVEKGIITAKRALVADEKLGFGRAVDYVPQHALSDADRIAAAMREEDYSSLPDDELMSFLEDAVRVEQKYGNMLAALETAGTDVIRYGRDAHRLVEQAFRDFGLKVLGPSEAQLLKSAEAISRFNEDAVDLLQNFGEVSDAAQLIRLYRTLIATADTVAEDRPGKGAAVNDQSIILKLASGGASALLGGDMQFAAPEVSGLEMHMRELRETVKSAGPYQFIKMSHHASYNAFDETLFREWAATRFYACSNGTNDATHPDHRVLRLLEGNADQIDWARTDRNGRITVTLTEGRGRFTIQRGDLNDFTPNGDIEGESVTEEKEEEVPEATLRPGRIINERGGLKEVSATAKLANDVTRVTITFEVPGTQLQRITTERAPQSRVTLPIGGARLPEPAALTHSDNLASGRRLPKLLFVTHRPGLENNLGRLEAQKALSIIRNAGQDVLEVQNPAAPYPEVRSKLQNDFAGVVILGGYDILPAWRLDVLPASLRNQLGNNTPDADNFIVWSDGGYGDRDGDMLPELPVSRLPDAKSPRLVMNALNADNPKNTQSRFGIRNSARPFAIEHYGLLSGNSALLVSEPHVASGVGSGKANGAHAYFMLHGSDLDATRYWGENQYGTLEALNILNIPRQFSGVVFTGCCWGALTIQTTAANYMPGQPLGVRTPGTSIALSYLHAGAKAFVGCTGTHYSPTVSPYDYFGGPMHRAFWNCYNNGAGPAEALYRAKIEYLRALPHGQASSMGQAIEFKILRQYTCLGLGW